MRRERCDDRLHQREAGANVDLAVHRDDGNDEGNSVARALRLDLKSLICVVDVARLAERAIGLGGGSSRSRQVHLQLHEVREVVKQHWQSAGLKMSARPSSRLR
jgi:hypothetical protein